MTPQLLEVVLPAPLHLPQTGPALCWPFFYLPSLRAAVICARVMPNWRDNAAGFTPAWIDDRIKPICDRVNCDRIGSGTLLLCGLAFSLGAVRPRLSNSVANASARRIMSCSGRCCSEAARFCGSTVFGTSPPSEDRCVLRSF